MAFLLANWAIRFISLVIKLLKKGGATSFPGSIALKIDANILRKFTMQLSKGAILVTGTNGKTSVATLLAGVLREAGFKVVHNSSGANLLGGVTVAFSQNADFLGRLDHDYAVIEADEGVFATLVQQLNPKAVIITNIFADQLDRYGDTEKALGLIAKGLVDLSPGSQVIVNGDDPLLSTLKAGPDIGFSYFCLHEKEKRSINEVNEKINVSCPVCNHPLNYHQSHYENLGKFLCSNCGFTNPDCQFWAEEIELMGLEGSNFVLSNKEFSFNLKIDLPGLYNIYNFLGVFALASYLQINHKAIESGLKNYPGSFGRMQKIQVDNKTAIMVLAKNAAGFNQVLKTLNTDKKQKLLFGINDQPSDGIDLSWLWDIDFDNLPRASLSFPLILSGTRGIDLQLALKYTEIDQVTVEEDLPKAFDLAIDLLQADEELIIIINYSAMLELQNYLNQKGLIKAFWQGD